MSMFFGLGAGGGTWTPADLANIYQYGTALAYDAGATYPDLSGNGRHLAATGAVALGTDVNGHPKIYIPSGAGSYFKRVETTIFGPTTISICAKIISVPFIYSSIFSADSLTDFQLDAGAYGSFIFRFNSAGIGAGSNIVTATDWLGSPHVFTLVLDTVAGLARLRVDDIFQVSTPITAASFSTDNFGIGTNRGVNAGCEMELYGQVINGSVDSAETSAIAAYLGSLAGLAL